MIPFTSFLKYLNVIVLITWLCLSQHSHAQSVTYVKHEVEGFEIFIHEEDLKEHPKEMGSMISFLGTKLEVIQNLNLETAIISLLRSVPIYVEWDNGHYGSVVYNRSFNGSDQSFNKWKAIDILNAKIFLKSDTTNQPYLILHELAHGYHDRLGKFEKDMITLSYHNAIGNGLYDQPVPNQHGEKVYAYARADEREYFAELTVAYLVKNTTYPFIAEELKVHDPMGFGMVAAIWRYAIP